MVLDPVRVVQLADSYLSHLLLIAEVGDVGANSRDFIDPWWSFTRGAPFVKDRVNPSQWTMNNPCVCGKHSGERQRAEQLDWISIGAREALHRRRCRDLDGELRLPSDRLIVDHSVPLSQVWIMLHKKGPWKRESLNEMLRHHVKRALLTQEEDAILNEAREGISLKSKMPLGWEMWGDPFARYTARGIKQSIVR